MTVIELSLRIDKEWRDCFILFVRGEDFDSKFLSYLEKNPDAQNVVEDAIAVLMGVFHF